MIVTLWRSAGGPVLASAIIQLTLNRAQRSVSPTKATIIYAGEPVDGRELPPGYLIVAGVLLSELRRKKKVITVSEP